MGKYKDKNGTTRVGDFLRKIKGITPELLNIAGSVSGIEALKNLGDMIENNDEINPKDKEMALKLLEFDILDAQETTKRWDSDMISDSWLSKNVRPLILVYLTLSTTVYIILEASIESFDIKAHWVELLSSLLILVFGGYFGARSIEKIFKIKEKNKGS